ncbi:hypothetical protein [Serinibacter salmoneus]|uniref:Gram-positive cocci surface proteins LPxTG domain-containing protein n=1 Tax=Serinibacter salmoneus TaxID=556530 RepID=A0A2A9D082_9MICO|nr:hypothetical protein [Serinibacter salmoneus]PFG19786.1 hypothetical protein ATL40_1357 [Serinibacter salmoneus]
MRTLTPTVARALGMLTLPVALLMTGPAAVASTATSEATDSVTPTPAGESQVMFEVTPDSVAPGGQVAVTGACLGFEGPGDVVEPQVLPRTLESGPALVSERWEVDDEGSFSGSLTIPEAALEGDYVVQVPCWRDGESVPSMVFWEEELRVVTSDAPQPTVPVDQGPQITVADAVVTPGSLLDVEGWCAWNGVALRNALVSLEEDGQSRASIEVEVSTGARFSGSLPVPHDVTPGQYEVTLLCRGTDMVLPVVSTAVTVPEGPESPASSPPESPSVSESAPDPDPDPAPDASVSGGPSDAERSDAQELAETGNGSLGLLAAAGGVLLIGGATVLLARRHAD